MIRFFIRIIKKIRIRFRWYEHIELDGWDYYII